MPYDIEQHDYLEYRSRPFAAPDLLGLNLTSWRQFPWLPSNVDADGEAPHDSGLSPPPSLESGVKSVWACHPYPGQQKSKGSAGFYAVTAERIF